MLKNFYSLSIIVNNKPVSEYVHESDTYIEGRNGSEYQLQIKNPTNSRVEAVVSVDGLSVIDGKPADSSSSGYIIKPFSTITIPGWRLDSDKVAKFKFGEKNKSYSNLSGHSTTNVGVIGVRFYAEEPVIWHKPFPYWGDWRYDYPLFGVTDTYTSSSPYIGNRALGATASATASYNYAAQSKGLNSVGTEFGKETGFKTSDIYFKRGSELETLEIYYDSRKNLEKRGIVISKPVFEKPKAFSDKGCTPPKGWKKS